MRIAFRLVPAVVMAFGVAAFLSSACSKENRSSAGVRTPASTLPDAQSAARLNQQVTLAKAPGFVLQDLSGKAVTWDQFDGKVVLVDFWATWCPPCRRSIPHLSDLYTKYESRGFTVVGISLDFSDKSVVARFARDYKIPYTVLIGNMDLAFDWGVGDAIPVAFLVNRDGEIVDKFVGYRDKSVLEKEIEKFL